MPNVKKITIDFPQTGMTTYCIIAREADSYLLNDADGSFAAAPADPYLSLAEHGTIKGRYSVSESRTAWNDGRYTVAVYQQVGGSPAPASDIIIGSGALNIISDTEVDGYSLNVHADTIEAAVAHATYGLSALKTILDGIKGAGWTTQTLKTIYEAVDTLEVNVDTIIVQDKPKGRFIR